MARAISKKSGERSRAILALLLHFLFTAILATLPPSGQSICIKMQERLYCHIIKIKLLKKSLRIKIRWFKKKKVDSRNKKRYTCIFIHFSSDSWVRIHQLFSRTFFVFFSKICNFECNTTTDWLNRTV